MTIDTIVECTWDLAEAQDALCRVQMNLEDIINEGTNHERTSHLTKVSDAIHKAVQHLNQAESDLKESQ